jgi:PTH2 family peptidyl-tRNA hydrolase
MSQSDNDINKSDELVMYFFVNTDLKMEKGKMCSQVGHVAQMITEEIVRLGYECNPVPELYYTYMKYKKHCKKIVLKATQEQLLELIKMDGARYVIDAGRTQVPENSLTVVGFAPCNNLFEKFKDYKLL